MSNTTETPAEKLARKAQEETGRAPAGPAKSRSKSKAKAPQDHKKPAPKPDKDGKVTVTVEGVEVTLDTHGMKDWRFIEASGAAEAGQASPADLYQLVAMVFPDRADRTRIANHVADETGFVDSAKFFEFYKAAIQEAGAKNF